MALVKCADCGKELSPRAAACPGCGAPAFAAAGVCVVVAPLAASPTAAPGPRCVLCGGKAEVKRREDAASLYGLLSLPCALAAAVAWWWVLFGASEGGPVGGLMPGPSLGAWVAAAGATLLVLGLWLLASRMSDRHLYCKACHHWKRA